jgi:hypothetical protein
MAELEKKRTLYEERGTCNARTVCWTPPYVAAITLKWGAQPQAELPARVSISSRDGEDLVSQALRPA